MTEKGGEEETVNLKGLGENRDEFPRPSKKSEARTTNKRLIIGVVVTVCLVILIIVGAWFIYTTVSDSGPEWLQTIPGLHYRPSSSPKGPVIHYNATNRDSILAWTHVIDDFLKDYMSLSPSGAANIINCNYDLFPLSHQVCHIDMKVYHNCRKEENYGYHRASPCIFLKIHKFPNWVPEYYNKSELPETMPAYLKEYIQRETPNRLKTLWVSCEGITGSDKEFIGPVQYFPQMGFPGYFFPYKNIDGFLSPLVALFLERPRAGVLINIECKLWAKNIVHDPERGIGMVQFHVMIN